MDKRKLNHLGYRIMKKIFILSSILLCILGISTSGYPITLTFDDLSENPNEVSGVGYYNWLYGPFPGYNEFDWGNTVFGNYIDSDSSHLYVGTGFQNGAVSGGFIAWPNFGGPTYITSINNPFDFIGAYFTSGYRLDMNILVEGYLEGTPQNSSTIVVSNDAPTWHNFNFLGIDELYITSYGGIPTGRADETFGHYYVMDNFTFNPNSVAPIPEPSTILLMSAGLIGLVAFRKKFKKG